MPFIIDFDSTCRIYNYSGSLPVPAGTQFVDVPCRQLKTWIHMAPFTVGGSDINTFICRFFIRGDVELNEFVRPATIKQLWMKVNGHHKTPFFIYFFAPVMVNGVRVAWYAYARYDMSKYLPADPD